MSLCLPSIVPNHLPSPSPRFPPPTCSLPSHPRLLLSPLTPSPFRSMPLSLLPRSHACGRTPCSRDDDDFDVCGLPISPVDDSDALPSSIVLPDRWDVVGVGQAMVPPPFLQLVSFSVPGVLLNFLDSQVDFSGVVNDAFLEKLGLDKGSRKVVNHEERGRVFQPWMAAVIRPLPGFSFQ